MRGGTALPSTWIIGPPAVSRTRTSRCASPAAAPAASALATSRWNAFMCFAPYLNSSIVPRAIASSVPPPVTNSGCVVASIVPVYVTPS